jgi:hypothetical protein
MCSEGSFDGAAPDASKSVQAHTLFCHNDPTGLCVPLPNAVSMPRFGQEFISQACAAVPATKHSRAYWRSSHGASAAPPALGQPRHDHAKPPELPAPASVPCSPSMEISPPCPDPANQSKHGITASIRWPGPRSLLSLDGVTDFRLTFNRPICVSDPPLVLPFEDH